MQPWLKFYETITKPLPVASSLFLVASTGFILFSPDALIVRLGMSRVVADYRWAVGLGFVIAATWLVVTALVWLYHGLVGRLSQFAAIRRAKEQVEKDIPQMTPKEREIIGCLLARNQRVFTNTIDGGYASTLISKRIVLPALLPGQAFTRYEFPFEIPEHVWSVLIKHKAEFPFAPPDSDEVAPHPWRVPWNA
jgi:hypothetical protein